MKLGRRSEDSSLAVKYSSVFSLSISSYRKFLLSVITFRVSTMVNWESSFYPSNVCWTSLFSTSSRTTLPELSKIRYLPFFRTTKMSSSSIFPMNEVKTTSSLTKVSLQSLINRLKRDRISDATKKKCCSETFDFWGIKEVASYRLLPPPFFTVIFLMVILDFIYCGWLIGVLLTMVFSLLYHISRFPWELFTPSPLSQICVDVPSRAFSRWLILLSRFASNSSWASTWKDPDEMNAEKCDSIYAPWSVRMICGRVPSPWEIEETRFQIFSTCTNG